MSTTKLYDAVAANNLMEVKRLINSGCNINETTNEVWGKSPLRSEFRYVAKAACQVRFSSACLTRLGVIGI